MQTGDTKEAHRVPVNMVPPFKSVRCIFFQSAVAGNDTQYIKGLQFKNPILRKKMKTRQGKMFRKNIDSMR